MTNFLNSNLKYWFSLFDYKIIIYNFINTFKFHY